MLVSFLRGGWIQAIDLRRSKAIWKTRRLSEYNGQMDGL